MLRQRGKPEPKMRYGEVPRHYEFCPVCGQSMPFRMYVFAPEVFCPQCETYLAWVEDEHAARWEMAGVYA